MHTEKVWKTRKKNKEVITIKSGEVTSRGDEKGCYWQRSQGVVGALGMLALSYPLLWEVITLLFVLFLDLVGWLYLHLFSNYSLNILYVLHLFHNISCLFKWLSKQNTIARFQGGGAVGKGTNFDDFGVSSSWHNVYTRRKVYKCWLNQTGLGNVTWFERINILQSPQATPKILIFTPCQRQNAAVVLWFRLSYYALFNLYWVKNIYFLWGHQCF